MDLRLVMLMRVVNRRRFLQLAGGSVAATMLSDSIARALAIPANRATRSLRDVEHIVVLMQENRAFDHYYGVMRGVRGFGDPHPVTLPSGSPVWYQADGATVVPPFRPDVGNLALTFIEDLDHGWDGTHEMFNGGNWDQWLPAKTTTCMAHMQRSDLPFHYALADAFTVCDGYHCSMLGPTDPNRYYMWTGRDGNDRQGGGPVIANDELGYGWQTYPERLQAAGVSWKIYQDAGDGLDQAGAWGYTLDPYIGNYGDNSLLYFYNYQNAAPGSPLYQAARTGTDVNQSGGFFDILAADLAGGQLPSVSWIVAPEAYTEHPAWPAGYGAWYTAGAGDELAIALANPGTYDLSVHGPNGFFRHFAGSPATVLQIEAKGDHDTGKLSLRVTDSGDRPGAGHHQPRVVLEVADAYGTDRRIELHGSGEITIDTRHSGGWYDIALSTQSDASFSYKLAGRLESDARLTSDPQLGRS